MIDASPERAAVTPAVAAVNCGVLQRLHAAVNAHDAQAVVELCSERVVWNDPASPGPLVGRDAVYRFHRDMMFRALPDVKVVLLEGPCISADGTVLAVRLRIAGTMTGPMDPPGFAATDRPLVFETAEFSRFEAGRLVHHRVVMDMLAMARQIGAVPKAGGIAERVNVWLQHVTTRFMRLRSSQAAGRSDAVRW